MPHTLNRLTASAVLSTIYPGLFADGGGLYLRVVSVTSKNWIFRYKRSGKARDMGLGSTHTVTLTEARKAAAKCRLLLQAGSDPIAERLAERSRAVASSMTFSAAAEAFLAAMEPKWRGRKQPLQWRASLTAYAFPVFGNLPVGAIDTALVLQAIEPIWATKTETASRVRSRVEQILDWCAVRGYRSGDNPARWRGHLAHVLPKRSLIAKVRHHPALPYADLPAFMVKLMAQNNVAARALEFTVLTAARTGETIGAKLSEFSPDLWIVPADRMKMKREHRCPLTGRSAEIIAECRALAPGVYAFPGLNLLKPLSTGAMDRLLERMGYSHVTVHGFRSTFRDWAAEQTNFPRELAELALAHRVGDDTEKAYQRGDLLEKRRKLMAAWGEYCLTDPAERGKVLALARA